MMPIEVDPSFTKTGVKARERRRKRRLARGGIGLAAVLVTGLVVLLGVWLFSSPWGAAPGEDQTAGGDGDEDFFLVQADGDEAAAAAVTQRFAPVLPADLQVDPLILRIASDRNEHLTLMPGPQAFVPERIGFSGPERIAMLQVPLVVAEQRLELVLPSSGDDFALFQAQRSQASRDPQAPATTAPQAPVEAGEVVAVDEESSWGDLISTQDDARAASQDNAGAAVYVETRIANTTSTALALRETERSALYEDTIVALSTERPLEQVLVSNGFDEEAADEIAEAAQERFEIPEALEIGSIVALRARREQGATRLLQMSVYGPEGYKGTLVQVGVRRFDSGADPWFTENLTDRTSELQQSAQQNREVRLIDAIYSNAIRNGLPQTLVGQMMVILSKKFDLDRFASEEDELKILYANTPGPMGEGLGGLLYVGIKGPSGKLQCYVTEANNDSGYDCFDFSGAGGGGSSGGGLVIPVKGVKTSGFGPRHHPILKQVRNHNGVDWAAPTGTPIVSALAGKVSYAGPGGGYGNVIYVDHPGGLQTRYAHMSRYGDFQKGAQVSAGDVIGYVGTTGRSTGPHLHFELRVNGAPVDPLTYRAPAAVAVAASVSTGGQPGSAAVEALVNKIIQVESAGNARAKNPLSSATGLGQFIESTWLRMMRDYRPELHKSMNRAQLLELRFDPALSREMVRNLAREGEAYLRNRGHPITPGHLYLAHFLGAGGAHKALSADRAASVLSVMGSGVVNANPFLRGKTIGDLIAWSDRKMRVKGSKAGTSSAPVAVARAVPPKVKAYKEAIDKLLEET